MTTTTQNDVTITPDTGLRLSVASATSYTRTLVMGTAVAVATTLGSYYSLSAKIDKAVDTAAQLKTEMHQAKAEYRQETERIHRDLDPLVWAHRKVSAATTKVVDGD